MKDNLGLRIWANDIPRGKNFVNHSQKWQQCGTQNHPSSPSSSNCGTRGDKESELSPSVACQISPVLFWVVRNKNHIGLSFIPELFSYFWQGENLPVHLKPCTLQPHLPLQHLTKSITHLRLWPVEREEVMWWSGCLISSKCWPAHPGEQEEL